MAHIQKQMHVAIAEAHTAEIAHFLSNEPTLQTKILNVQQQEPLEMDKTETPDWTEAIDVDDAHTGYRLKLLDSLTQHQTMWNGTNLEPCTNQVHQSTYLAGPSNSNTSDNRWTKLSSLVSSNRSTQSVLHRSYSRSRRTVGYVFAFTTDV